MGLGAAADYLRDLGMANVREHERELVEYALEVLPRARPVDRAVRAAGPTCAAASCRSTSRASTRTTWPRCSTGTGSRSGPATTARCRCTNGSISAATARASFGVYTTKADIDALASGLQQVVKLFGVEG